MVGKDATPARSRANLLRTTLSEHEATLVDIEATLAEMPARQRAARVAALSKSPTQFSGKVGSEALKLEDEERKLIAKRDNLVAEIEAVKDALIESQGEQRAELRESCQAQADKFDDAERKAWLKFGSAYATLIHAYNAILDVAEGREAYVASLDWDDNNDRLALEPMFRPWQQPFPVDPPAAFEMAADASADPKGFGVFGGGLGLEVRLGKLPSVMPDLRLVYRYGKLTRGEKVSTTQDAVGPIGWSSSPLPSRAA